jgi:hypothetical protein
MLCPQEEAPMDPQPSPDSTQNGGPDPTEVKPSWLWVKDARGYGSVTTTLVLVSFVVTTVAYVLSIVDKVGSVSIRPFDVAACSSYFGPILALYFGRKFTDAKYKAPPGT